MESYFNIITHIFTLKMTSITTSDDDNFSITDSDTGQVFKYNNWQYKLTIENGHIKIVKVPSKIAIEQYRRRLDILIKNYFYLIFVCLNLHFPGLSPHELAECLPEVKSILQHYLSSMPEEVIDYAISTLRSKLENTSPILDIDALPNLTPEMKQAFIFKILHS